MISIYDMTPESRIDETFRLTPAQKTALVKLHLHTILELLYHFPTRYSSISEIRNISELTIGEKAVIYGRISNLKTAKGPKSKMTYRGPRVISINSRFPSSRE